VSRGSRSRGDIETAESEATDVLAGRRRVGLRRLVELIRTINPTGLDLPRAMEERCYATKSRLQSLLLRTFPDEVEARLEPGAPEQVLLRLPRSGQEACHALIDGLDPDVRARVRWQLDTADPGEAPGLAPGARAPRSAEAPPGGGQSPDDHLDLGRAALEAFDLEAAREHLEAAFALGRGAPAAALPLLELLVEHLADYPAARRLEPALSPEALERPRVRALLAMAAAHTGDARLAVRLLRDVEDTAAGDVLAVLAATAIRAGELAAAERHLDALRERCPAHPEVHPLAVALARARELVRQPFLEALRQAVAREDLAEARRVANQVLEQWPDDALARRTLADLEARQRRETATARCAGAWEALGRGDLARAATLAREARSLGGDYVGLEAAIADAVEAARQRKDQVRVTEVVDRLTAELTAAGLVALTDTVPAPTPYPLVRPLPSLPLDQDEPFLLPSVIPPFWSCGHDPDRAVGLIQSSGELARAPITEQEARIRGWLEDGAPGAGALVALANALLRTGAGDRATEVLLRAQERCPDDPRVGLALAGAAAEAGRWVQVRQALGPVDASGLPASLVTHRFHLLGCAHLHLGDLEGARQVFAEGLTGGPDHCGLELCLELATDLSKPLPEQAWDETQSMFRQLLGALRSADRCLAAGDPDGARRLLWHEIVWKRRDRQCLARLAEACLRKEPVVAVERLRSRLALASFLHAFEERFPVSQLFLPGGTWSQERLASLAKRARAWLDGS
jgi:tetratricopeptide (TPR) repeat protein